MNLLPIGKCTRSGRVLAPIAAFAAANWWANRQRPDQRITSHEEIEDPAVSAAYGQIATWPQMRLLRKIVIDRTLAMITDVVAADIGCGPGHLVIELAQRAPGLRLTGVDLAELFHSTITDRRQRIDIHVDPHPSPGEVSECSVGISDIGDSASVADHPVDGG